MFNFSSCLGVHPLSLALFTGLRLSQPGSFPLSAPAQPFPPKMPPPALHRGCLPSSQEETDRHTACISHLKVKAHHLLCTSCRLQFSYLRCVSKQGARQLHSCSLELIIAKLNFQIQWIFLKNNKNCHLLNETSEQLQHWQITVFYLVVCFGFFFQHRLPGYKGGIFITDGNVPFSCILPWSTGNANIFFNLSLCPLQLQDVTTITFKIPSAFFPLERMTFHNLINHMQNLIKESPHLTLPSILKEHVQYSI